MNTYRYKYRDKDFSAVSLFDSMLTDIENIENEIMLTFNSISVLPNQSENKTDTVRNTCEAKIIFENAKLAEASIFMDGDFDNQKIIENVSSNLKDDKWQFQIINEAYSEIYEKVNLFGIWILPEEKFNFEGMIVFENVKTITFCWNEWSNK